MAQQKRKKITLTTPRVALVFPKLNTPDLGTKDYPKDPPGEWVTKARMEKSDPRVQAFLAKLQPYQDAAIKNGEAAFAELKIDARKKLEKKGGLQINDLYTEVYDKETEKPTGEIEMKFAAKAGGVTKLGKAWKFTPVIVDGRGQAMRKVPDIWGGTTAIISFEIDPEGYFISGTGACGLSKRLAGVQIIDLVQGGQRSASSLGFSAQEDGYAHDDNATEDDSADDADTSDMPPYEDGVGSDDF